MSMFLGPIHYMMFNKIKIASGRARAVAETFRKKFGADADETIKAALPGGFVDFGDAALDELLGDNPIHQFLQGLIDKVETAEASLVTALIYRFPDEGKYLAVEAYKHHGERTAKEQIGGSSHGALDLNAIANFLNQIYLEGMPCDAASSYNFQNQNALKVDHSDCLHKRKWESVGAPIEIMCELLDSWIVGCATTLHPGLKIERSASIAAGNDSCSCLLKG